MRSPLHRIIVDDPCCDCEESSGRAERLEAVRDQLSTIIAELDNLSEHQAAANIDMAIQCLRVKMGQA